MSEVAVVRCSSYDSAEVRAAVERGVSLLGGEITLLGDPIEPFIANDYNVNRLPGDRSKAASKPSALKSAITPRPYITGGRCVKCGVCVNACPVDPKAVNWHDGG